MLCDCSRLGWTMKTTLRISTSAQAAYASAGRRAMPIRCGRSKGPHGTTIAIRSRALFYTIRRLTPRRHANDAAGITYAGRCLLLLCVSALDFTLAAYRARL